MNGLRLWGYFHCRRMEKIHETKTRMLQATQGLNCERNCKWSILSNVTAGLGWDVLCGRHLSMISTIPLQRLPCAQIVEIAGRNSLFAPNPADFRCAAGIRQWEAFPCQTFVDFKSRPSLILGSEISLSGTLHGS